MLLHKELKPVKDSTSVKISVMDCFAEQNGAIWIDFSTSSYFCQFWNWDRSRSNDRSENVLYHYPKRSAWAVGPLCKVEFGDQKAWVMQKNTRRWFFDFLELEISSDRRNRKRIFECCIQYSITTFKWITLIVESKYTISSADSIIMPVCTVMIWVGEHT